MPWKENGAKVYQGENGKEEGFGILVFVSGAFKGDRYEGEFRNGQYNGKGIYSHTSGERYEGDYKNNKRNGKCIYYFADGSWTEGEARVTNCMGRKKSKFGNIINA